MKTLKQIKEAMKSTENAIKVERSKEERARLERMYENLEVLYWFVSK